MTMLLAVASAVVLASEVAGAASQPDPCDNSDGAWDTAGFVLVVEPAPGTRVAPGFVVRGCSRTFESNVTWRLVGRKGALLSNGHATGGGIDGPSDFRFTVDYTTNEKQVAYLEVSEPVITEAEGHPPSRTVIPLVLLPAARSGVARETEEAMLLPTGDWTLETLEGEPIELERPITFQLDENGRVSGFAGCNRYFTQWGDEGEGRVRLGVVATTRMYCPDTQQVETRFLGALAKVAGARRAGSHLELTDAAGKVLLRFARTAR